MTLDEFVEDVMLERGIDLEYKKSIIDGIKSKARQIAKEGCSCLTDEEVRELVINPKTKLTRAEIKPKENDGEIINLKKISKPVGVTQKVGGDGWEQESLF